MMKGVLETERNSLVYWFPKVKDLGIPTPKTSWIVFPPELSRKMLNESDEAFKKFAPYLEKIKKEAEKFGYPVFIRTDQASHKHGWKDGAFVRNESDMMGHIMNTLEFNEMAGMLGLGYKAVVIREFLELDWRFKAFYGEMPVAKERRYFVNNGEVLCHHPYWNEDSVTDAHVGEGTRNVLGYLSHRLPNKWQEMLKELNFESVDEVTLLTGYALKVAEVLDGYWSIDFACTRNQKWYLIDMAVGYDSYHLPCESKLEKVNDIRESLKALKRQ